MSPYSYDTNILIDSLNGHEHARAELRRVEDRWISRVTWIEVMSKVDTASRPVIEQLFTDFQIDELDYEISERAAELRRDTPRLKLPDAIILASAQVNHRLLVTRNTRDFPADQPGVRVPYTL